MSLALASRQSGFGLLLALMLVLTPAQASMLEQREWFKQAEQALQQNDQLQFAILKRKLEDYPIVAYLEHDAFKQRLKQADGDELRDFLHTHRDYPFHYQLLGRWLKQLARTERWPDYLEFYDGRNETRYRCHWLTARIETGDTRGIEQEIQKIWLSGYSQPDECDPAFAYFLEHQPDVEKYIWQRIEKAFQARRPSLAKYLAKKLPEQERKLVDTWYQAHKNPADNLPRLVRLKDTTSHRKILLHAIHRLARRDSAKALQYWQQVQDRFAFSAQQVGAVEKRIALSSALQHRADAKQLLEQLPDDLKNDNAHLWLARINLRDEDWIGLLKSIDAMPERLKSEAEWTYWMARAYGEAGHEVKAGGIFDQLAERSSYYGFLAADRSDKDYQIRQEKVSLPSPQQDQQLLNDNPHLLRARELFFVDRNTEARREWFQGIRKLSTEQIKRAAQLAYTWKWYDNAIKTVAKTSHRRDYDLRFPMPYQDQVMDRVASEGLDPSIVYGIMRRESLFDPLAKSRVGALGLMQLMPSTARNVARKLGMKQPAQWDILDIENNIRLGTRYFRTVLNRFDNNVPLAAAAYNAGPLNVKKWLPESETLPADLWVETVPFKETRNYIQAVLAYATIFDRHLDQDILISSRMQDVRATY